MHKRRIALAALFLLSSAASAQTVAQGKTVFQTCAACHTGEAGSLGPSLNGVVGRKAGSLAGFHFSGPMQRSGLTWTPETLVRYLMGPQTVVPGNRMPLAPLSKADAQAVVKYLATLH